MGRNSSLSTKKLAQILILSNLKSSVRLITQKMKVSQTAEHNAILKLRVFSRTEKGLVT